MRLLTRGGVRLVALVAVLAASAVGGIAYASIPDAGGVIHGCYNVNAARSTGGTSLKIIDSDSGSCSNGEQPIVWNQTGPEGPTGPTGPRGPSDAWDASSAGVSVPAGGAATILSLSLPAGKFFVSAKASISGGGGYTCVLKGPAGDLDSSLTVANALASVPMESTVALASAGSVYVTCTSTTNQATVSGHIDAIEIGTLH